MRRGPARRGGALREWEARFGPNMTPMVDIVICILVFFMASATFLGPEWFLRAALPQPGAGAATGEAAPADPFALPPPRFDLRVYEYEGRVYVAGLGAGPIVVDALARELADLSLDVDAGDAELVLLPSPSLRYQDLVRVRDECARAGFQRVAIWTEAR